MDERLRFSSLVVTPFLFACSPTGHRFVTLKIARGDLRLLSRNTQIL
ncbi:hypothetical protein KKH3_00300 [Pectobacterium actinidiae]|nr:hypothetical protein KKH3_00300 [Pectobacterium actinidiae]